MVMFRVMDLMAPVLVLVPPLEVEVLASLLVACNLHKMRLFPSIMISSLAASCQLVACHEMWMYLLELLAPVLEMAQVLVQMLSKRLYLCIAWWVDGMQVL